MIVVPAIDIRHGRVVRLHQGRPEEETAYGDDPAAAARRWETEGAERLHLVHLDAAIDDRPQGAAVATVVGAVGIPVAVGRGLRTLDPARRYRHAGVERLILRTAAVTAPAPSRTSSPAAESTMISRTRVVRGFSPSRRVAFMPLVLPGFVC